MQSGTNPRPDNTGFAHRPAGGLYADIPKIGSYDNGLQGCPFCSGGLYVGTEDQSSEPVYAAGRGRDLDLPPYTGAHRQKAGL